MVNKSVAEDFLDIVQGKDKSKTNSTHSAIVSRIDDEGTVWVRVAGSENETPVASVSSEVKKNDAVNVEWRNNRLYIVGNPSNPSAGITRVAHVEESTENIREELKMSTNVLRGAIEDLKKSTSHRITTVETSGRWKIRKYTFGEFEAWYTTSGTLTIATKVGSLYQSASNSTINLPSGSDWSVSSVEYADVKLMSSSYGVWSYISGVTVPFGGTGYISYRGMSALSRASSTYTIQAYVKGTWYEQGEPAVI